MCSRFFEGRLLRFIELPVGFRLPQRKYSVFQRDLNSGISMASRSTIRVVVFCLLLNGLAVLSIYNSLKTILYLQRTPASFNLADPCCGAELATDNHWSALAALVSSPPSYPITFDVHMHSFHLGFCIINPISSRPFLSVGNTKSCRLLFQKPLTLGVRLCFVSPVSRIELEGQGHFDVFMLHSDCGANATIASYKDEDGLQYDRLFSSRMTLCATDAIIKRRALAFEMRPHGKKSILRNIRVFQ